jgi:3-methyladenine DNA glycosylase AlkD
VAKIETTGLSASKFMEKLSLSKSATDLEKNQRYFKDGNLRDNKILGVRFATIFKLAKEFREMEPAHVEKLLDSRYYEARMGAVSIMDFQARNKKTTEFHRKVLFDMYIRKHDRINNWDLVDRSAPYVIGGYLSGKSRSILYKLAKSKNIWERRTAIVSTYYFIRQDDVEDTFKIARMLVSDKEEMIHMAVGSWIREAGKRHPQKLFEFLDKYSSKMPRIMLRYAVEKLDKKQKDYYLKAKSS